MALGEGGCTTTIHPVTKANFSGPLHPWNLKYKLVVLWWGKKPNTFSEESPFLKIKKNNLVKLSNTMQQVKLLFSSTRNCGLELLQKDRSLCNTFYWPASLSPCVKFMLENWRDTQFCQKDSFAEQSYQRFDLIAFLFLNRFFTFLILNLFWAMECQLKHYRKIRKNL